MKQIKLLFASNISAAVSIIVITLVAMIAEVSPRLKDFLKSLSGHHWLTKSYAVIVIYFVLLVILATATKKNEAEDLRRSFIFMLAALIFGSLILFIFFLWHYWAG